MCQGLKNKYNIVMVMIAILFVCGTFIMHFQDYATYISDATDFQNADEITVDNTVVQDFVCEYNNLNVLHILFSTSDRFNIGMVVLELVEGDTCIQKWNIDTRWIDDNQYLMLNLDHKIKSKGKSYAIRMISDAQTGNGVSPVNYKLQYATLEHKSLYLPFIVLLLITIFISFAVWFVVQRKTIKIEKTFILLWCAFSMMYACSNTMHNAPDESHHFYRAFEISMGHMVSDMNEEQTKGGRKLPLDTKFSCGKWQSFVEDREARLSENMKFFAFSNTALYTPVSYIPQSLGILLARLITDRIAIITYAGRFANWLCVTIILYFAMKLLPFGKEFLAIVLLMPMNLHEAFSLAPDAMVVSVSVLMVAFVMHLRYVQKTHLTKTQILLLYILALLISLYKIVYLPFCLLYLLIPKERFGNAKKMAIHAVFIAGLVVVLNVVWLQVCNKFLTHVGANGTLQMATILHHPINYCITIFRTYSVYTLQLLNQMVGSTLGPLAVYTNTVLVFAYLFLLFNKTNYNLRNVKDKNTVIEKSIFAVVIVAIILLTSTSLYIQWTFVGENTILGLQGRYFIALLLPFYFFVTGTSYYESREEEITVTSSAVAMAFNACSCIALLFYCLE